MFAKGYITRINFRFHLFKYLHTHYEKPKRISSSKPHTLHVRNTPSSMEKSVIIPPLRFRRSIILNFLS
jgi:hypothetical protein